MALNTSFVKPEPWSEHIRIRKKIDPNRPDLIRIDSYLTNHMNIQDYDSMCYIFIFIYDLVVVFFLFFIIIFIIFNMKL